ncbi:unnamed protein product [Caenorhabditis sp. 36 PRJEB53466]|nr:unnamed protein product [Caenorhabditis sp. 36 PRJEB53466]
MRIHQAPLCTFLAIVFQNSDAFNTRVKRHDRVDFRSSSRQSVIQFDFLGHEYVVDLEPNRAAYHPDFNVYTTDGPQVVRREEYFAVVREPFPGKGVLSQLEENLYIGTIYFHNDTLHLEPTHPHGLDEDAGTVVGYFGSDVDSKLDLSTLPTRSQVSFSRPNPFLKSKRSVSEGGGRRNDILNEKRNRCTLKLVADYSFFETFGKNSVSITTNFLVNMVARVNEIYTPINWDLGKEDEIQDRGRFENMGFTIKEIKVLDRLNESSTHYNNNGIWEVETLLREFAFAEGSKDFCLVHLVTARTFKEKATLGLAYLSYKTEETAGGICSKKETFNGKIAYINVLLSTSTANLDQTTYPLITKELDIVVSHEYGHAWGAQHDPTIESNDTDVEQCSPSYQDGGSFLMSQYAQNGYDPNNVLFSPCSRKAVREVLTHKWKRCFQEEITSYCGNGIVEDGEECDNGKEDDPQDVTCCDKFCRLNVGAQCSPLNHICCTKTCQFQNSSHVCLPGDSLLCKANAVCNGYSGDCPPAPPVEDGKECIEKGECLNGICLPFCQKKSIGKKSCICEDLELSCRRCCRDMNGTCSPFDQLTYLRDGVKCSKGTCRNKKCVNEAVDNVRNYFLAPFQDRKLLYDSLKANLVATVIVVASFLFFPIYLLVSYLERNSTKPHPGEELINFRQVHVSAEGNQPLRYSYT